MATPEELRERLRAKRDAQIQHQQRCEAVHAEGRRAVQDLITLGYDFPKILELAEGQVSAGHLDAHFKAMGYYRRKEPPVAVQWDPQNAFGAPRWLNNSRNYTIFLEDSEPESASEDSEVEGGTHSADMPNAEAIDAEAEAANAEAIDAKVETTDAEARDIEALNVEAPNVEAASQVEAAASLAAEKRTTPDAQPSIASMAEWEDTDMPDVTDALQQPAGLYDTPAHLSDASTGPHKLGASKNSGIEYSTESSGDGHSPDNSGDLAEPGQLSLHSAGTGLENVGAAAPDVNNNSPVLFVRGANTPQEEGEPSHSNDQAESLSDSYEPDAENAPRVSTQSDGRDPRTGNGPQEQLEHKALEAQQTTVSPARGATVHASTSKDGQAGLGPSPSNFQAGPDDSGDSSSEDETSALTGDSIREELRRVQEQLRAVQERKHAKEVRREAEAAIQKRTAELSAIAAKRAVLMQARHKLNLPKLTSRVSRLEAKLKNTKELVLNAAVQLKDINAQSLELEKREIRIRNELARPAPLPQPHEAQGPATEASTGGGSKVVVVDGEGAVNGMAKASVPAEALPVKVLTAADSPLRMFGSWRLAPLGPRHWFSPSFNGRFVKDLDVREFCNVDLNGEKCVDRDCEFVHYRDFEVPPSLVVEYMATRGIGRPGFKEGLVEAIRTHLSGREASPEQLAAAVVGFRQQYDASQVLDWDSWGAKRPL